MTTLGIDIGGTSIKLAVVRDGETLLARRSAAYRKPSRAELVGHLRALLAEAPRRFDGVGLCVPGLLDRGRRLITESINLPGLNGVPLDDFVREGLGERSAGGVELFTDAQATAYDLYSARRLTGRLMLLALGTGVGVSVWDEDGPLRVVGESSGHFGQIDVSLEADAPVGPDGGRGGLEAYLGTAALRERYGPEFAALLPSLGVSEPPLRALARAIRIGHAIYRPQHVCLAGGVGNLLVAMLPALRALICSDLSSIAREGWTLTCGEDGFHAARGAGKLWAARSS